MARGRSPHRPSPVIRLASRVRLGGVGGGRVSVASSAFALEGRGRVAWPEVAAHELFGADGRIAGSRDEALLVRLEGGLLTEPEGVGEIEPGLYLLSRSGLTRIWTDHPDLAGDALAVALAAELTHQEVRCLQETLWATDDDAPSLLTIACKLADYRDVDEDGTERLLDGLAARGLVHPASDWDGYRVSDLGFFLLGRA